MFTIFTFITLISLFLTIMIALFFIVARRGYRNENRLLAALLLVFSLQIIYAYMTSNFTFKYFMEWHKYVFMLRQTSLLIGPLIYFYVRSFLNKEYTLRFSGFLNLLPFILVMAGMLIYYRNMTVFVIWESPVDLYSTILILTHNFIYLVLSIKALKSMNIGFRDFFGRVKISPHHTWLQMILIGFIAVWIINLNSFALYWMIQKPWWCAFTASIFALAVFLFVNAVMFSLLLKPDMFYVLTKYKNSKLTETEKHTLRQRLEIYMDTRKPYLNPDLTLEALAEEVTVSPRVLSQLINESYNKNFKGFVLEYRIRESMRLLADEKQGDRTVLEILYQVGFNSKSAFNNQFKLFTNQTPQEYRSKFVSAYLFLSILTFF